MTVSALADAKSRIGLYGSAKVLKKLAELERTGAHLGSPEGRGAILEVVREARKDTTLDGAMVADADLALILFGPDHVVGGKAKS